MCETSRFLFAVGRFFVLSSCSYLQYCPIAVVNFRVKDLCTVARALVRRSRANVLRDDAPVGANLFDRLY